MDTSSLLIAFGPPLTFKAPAPKLIISDEFKTEARYTCMSYFECFSDQQSTILILH